jgi:SHS2 domain-containing protein
VAAILLVPLRLILRVLPHGAAESGRLVSYRWIEHTSELELQIEAASEAAVFEQALEALRELIEEGRAGQSEGKSVSRGVQAAAGDSPALLAAWLDELVYLIETEDLVPDEVERLELAGERLTARVRAHRGRPRHLVKGVTYHKLTFSPDGDEFSATVVLDV